MESMQTAGLKRSGESGPGAGHRGDRRQGRGRQDERRRSISRRRLRRTGRRVMLLDGDLGLANVDVFLGLSPRHTMAHVLSGERSLEEIILESPHGVQVVPGASGVADMANLSAAGHLGLVQAFSALSSRVDVLIVDTSAGISHSVRAVLAGGAARAARRVRRAGLDDRCLRAGQGAESQPRCDAVPGRREHGARARRGRGAVPEAAARHQSNSSMSRWSTSGKSLKTRICDAQSVNSVPSIGGISRQVPSTRAFKKLALKADKWPVPDGPRGNLEFFVERLVRRPQARLEVVR